MQGNILKTMLTKERVCLLLRLIVGVIYIMASAEKIWDPAGFAEAVTNYQLLPESMVNIVALIMPWIEFVIGLFLIIGVWLPGASVMANGLFIVFFGLLITNMIRGLDIHCGCFSNEPSGEPNTTWYFIRDIIFVILGSSLLYFVMSLKDSEDGHSVCMTADNSV